MSFRSKSCPYCGVREGEPHATNCAFITGDFSNAVCMCCGGRDGTHTQTCLYVHKAPSSKIEIAIPPEVQQYSDDIRRFVDAMVYKLAIHANKGRWENLTAESQLPLLEGEVTELREALQRGNLIEVLLESADVANYGLIIASIAIERGK